MKIKILIFTAAFLLATVFSTVGLSQRPSTASPKTGNDLLAALPQSDAVALVKVRRLVDEALPRILANAPAKLAEVNTQIDQFKTKTGVDLHLVDQVAVGMRYTYPREGITKVESLTLARGAFNAESFAAAGKTAPGKYRAEKYHGHSIYIFTLDQQIKVAGVLNMPVHDLAITLVENDLLAMGSPASLRNFIDTQKARGAVNAELIALATKDPNALIGFGGNVTPALLQHIDIGDSKDVSTIRQVYGTVGLSEKDVEVFLAARTTSAESAKNLKETLEGLAQLAGAFYVGRLPEPKRSVAQTALNNLKVTTQGNELRVTTAVGQTQLGSLMQESRKAGNREP